MNVTASFQPHPLFRGGHLQTLAGFYSRWTPPPHRARCELLEVSDSDRIAIHDDCPDAWTASDRVVLLVHGLAGCHGSGYMVRLASRLVSNGIRCFRLDMRGTGAAAGRARKPGHAGRTDDLAIAIRYVADECPQAPLTLVGFSMGGNIALGTTVEASHTPIGNLTHCIAISPPVDLSRCCHELRRGTSRFYDQYLVRWMLKLWRQNGGEVPERTPTSIYDFDDRITAPLSGYRDAEDYYAHCSSGPRLREISLPTTILTARDDPMVSYGAIAAADRSESVTLIATDSGGHLGYMSSKRHVDDGRWMDWQLTQWILAH